MRQHAPIRAWLQTALVDVLGQTVENENLISYPSGGPLPSESYIAIQTVIWDRHVSSTGDPAWTDTSKVTFVKESLYRVYAYGNVAIHWLQAALEEITHPDVEREVEATGWVVEKLTLGGLPVNYPETGRDIDIVASCEIRASCKTSRDRATPSVDVVQILRGDPAGTTPPYADTTLTVSGLSED